MILLFLGAVLCAVGCASTAEDHGAPIALRVLDSVTLEIEQTGWGEVITYRVPEYAFPERDRGRIAANNPVTDSGNVTFSGTAEAPEPGSYEFRFETHDDYLAITATVMNLGDEVWDSATTCIMCLNFSSTETLNDSTRTNTYVTRERGLVAIRDIPSRPHHAAHALDPAYLEHVDRPTVKRYFGHGDVANSLIIRSSSDGERHVAIAWDDARNVSYNFRRDYRCIHSEPRFAGIQPGEKRVVKGRVYLFSGTREALIARFNADFPEQVIGAAAAPQVER